uniref:Uncharacterized protein n=1 Tax=Picea glauca TaxID=3330 RepID=A0A117NJ82_PICGL|nr:hypothetical protein ABT39_MTgene957 [Picea glauca]
MVIILMSITADKVMSAPFYNVEIEPHLPLRLQAYTSSLYSIYCIYIVRSTFYFNRSSLAVIKELTHCS